MTDKGQDKDLKIKERIKRELRVVIPKININLIQTCHLTHNNKFYGDK